MRIGIDLDNTIIFYDDAFVQAAIGRGLLPSGFTGTKQQVRDAIRLLDDGETEWQKLQGYVYGKGLSHASLFPGVEEFLNACKARGDELFIVSHKTEYGHFDPERVNLREAARQFLADRGIFAHVPKGNVHFATTRGEKVAVIRRLNLDYFIDDLVEVYEEQDFPKKVHKILFHAAPTTPPEGDWQLCKDWQEIESVVMVSKVKCSALSPSPLGGGGGGGISGKALPDNAPLLASPLPGEETTKVAKRLIGKPVTSVTHAAGGGNSRIYKVITGNKPYALKLYPTIDKDPRDRLGVEKKALQFFVRHGITCVPHWIAAEPPFALMEWIEGSLVTEPAMDDIDAAVAFLSRIFSLSRTTPPDSMPLASEACLSGAEILRQIGRRLHHLNEIDHPELAAFLRGEFAPALARRKATAQGIYAGQGMSFDNPVSQAQRCLIPADFGFHNAMRTQGGRLVFIDFEYFGWDDPVKLICDILLHPAMRLSDAMRRRFCEGLLRDDPALEPRIAALYPLFGLRWALILLNEFLPERWQARAFARGDTSWDDTRRRQLQKAQAMLAKSAAFATEEKA